LISELNLGSISQLIIPAHWSTLPLERSGRYGSVAQPYALTEDEEVKFMMYSRGKEVASDIAHDFQVVLAMPPHILTAEEYATIEVVLRHMSEDDFFERRFVETQVIDGRSVLVVEGTWKRSGVKNLAVFVDGNGKGSIIDEFHFYAPTEKYDQYLSEGQAIYQSIRFANGDKQSS
jgi:hypothetical protein